MFLFESSLDRSSGFGRLGRLLSALLGVAEDASRRAVGINSSSAGAQDCRQQWARDVFTQAAAQGYTTLPMPDDEDCGPVRALLIKGDERVLVLSVACRRWSRNTLQALMDSAHANAVWLPRHELDGMSVRYTRIDREAPSDERAESTSCVH